MTAPDVGSGALLGRFCRGRKWLGLKSMIMVNRLGASSLRWCCNLESHLSFETETFLRLRSRAGNFLIAANARLRAAKNCGLCSSRSHRTPNVKDEPRPWLARRVPNYDLGSVVSGRDSFGSTRRDGHGRWLWRLVGPFFGAGNSSG